MNNAEKMAAILAFAFASTGCGGEKYAPYVELESASTVVESSKNSTQDPQIIENAQEKATNASENRVESPQTFDALLAAGTKIDASGKIVDFSEVAAFDGFDFDADAPRWTAVKVVRGRGALSQNALRSFAKLPNLTEFLWTGAQINAVDAPQLQEFLETPTLKSLKKIRLTGLSDENNRFPKGAFAALAQIPNLVELDLSEAPATADDLKTVNWNAKGFPKLTKLTLYRTNVGDAGVVALTPLADRLLSLNLDESKIGPDSASEIARFTRLTFLHIGRTSLDDASVLKFGALRDLKKIHITRTNATEAGADALRAQLPGCEVVSQPEN